MEVGSSKPIYHQIRLRRAIVNQVNQFASSSNIGSCKVVYKESRKPAAIIAIDQIFCAKSSKPNTPADHITNNLGHKVRYENQVSHIQKFDHIVLQNTKNEDILLANTSSSCIR